MLSELFSKLAVKIAYAQGEVEDIDTLVQKLNTEIINPLIKFLFIIAFLIFFWGVFQFIRGGDNTEAKKTGKLHMTWGIIGLAIMFSAFGIINLLIGTLGD